MKMATESSGTAILGRRFYENLSSERLAQAHANAIKAEFLGSGFSPIAAGDVRSVRTPTLLLTGERSPALFGHIVRYLGELLPNAETRTIPDASHIMHEDNPEEFRRLVLSFLENQAISTAG